jgi:hypothetical protein
VLSAAIYAMNRQRLVKIMQRRRSAAWRGNFRRFLLEGQEPGVMKIISSLLFREK